MQDKTIPTLYDWVGGMPALERLTGRFYQKVLADPLLSAFVGYLEWGSRLAVINSQPGAQIDPDAPMPHWGWGEVGGPYQG